MMCMDKFISEASHILKQIDGDYEPVDGDCVYESLKYVMRLEANMDPRFHAGPVENQALVKLMTDISSNTPFLQLYLSFSSLCVSLLYCFFLICRGTP